jgi:glucosamine-6-phosphate deaminase
VEEHMPSPEREFLVDSLKVKVYRTRKEMGRAAGISVAGIIRDLASKKDYVSILFAAAPSQNEFLETLRSIPEIPWDKVVAFHLDEYVGLDPDSPQRFGNWLRDRIFDPVGPAIVHYLDGNAPDLEEECRRYSELLKMYPPDIACIGVGENGHIAFNDPHVADFDDPYLVKVVELDERSRLQQVHDGCFARLEDVPRHALTLTIPACVSAGFISCVVPGPTKAEAVRRMLLEPIREDCPASVLRNHPNAVLYLDMDSAALFLHGV